MITKRLKWLTDQLDPMILDISHVVASYTTPENAERVSNLLWVERLAPLSTSFSRYFFLNTPLGPIFFFGGVKN